MQRQFQFSGGHQLHGPGSLWSVRQPPETSCIPLCRWCQPHTLYRKLWACVQGFASPPVRLNRADLNLDRATGSAHKAGTPSAPRPAGPGAGLRGAA